jgi:HAD superfamily hydrolase (TIGR01459 family)
MPDHTRSSATPPILANAGTLLSRYDAVFCDVWGVVHNGVDAYDDACRALQRFRDGGGTVILLTNAPVPEHRVEAMLALRRVPRGAWDAIVSSGAIALRHLVEHRLTKLYGIGPRDRDAAFFEKAAATLVSIDEAQAIVATGLNDDRSETAEDYRPVLEQALARRLPFVCANPDLVVDVGGTLYLCAGAIADVYAHMGGEVFWAGKPHASAYETAFAKVAELRGRPVAHDRVLVIGDALRTDLEGARRAGLNALFVAGGIHRSDVVGEDVAEAGRIVPAKLDALFGAADAPPAIGAMIELKW